MILSRVLKCGSNFFNGNLTTFRTLSYKSKTAIEIEDYHKNKSNESDSTVKQSDFGEIKIKDLEIKYLNSSKSGGQNVNKIHSKVQIQFHVPSVQWIPSDIKESFMQRESHRMTKEKYFVISSDATRSQLLNQADCMDRIRYSIRECIEANKTPETSVEKKERWEHIITRANEKRLQQKKKESFNKATRQDNFVDDI